MTKQPLLKIQNLNTTLHQNGAEPQVILQNVGLSVDSNEIVALVGFSGSGKTMLWSSITGVLQPLLSGKQLRGKQLRGGGGNGFEVSCNLSGTIITDASARGNINSENTIITDASARGNINSENTIITDASATLTHLLGKHRGIGIVFQEPNASLDPIMGVGKQLDEVLSLHCDKKLGRQQRRQRVIEALRGVELSDEYYNRLPHQLSGGEAQRIAIALAIANNPKLIIADEPTSNLDSTNQRLIIHMLQTLCKQSNTALILITHNIALALTVAQRVVVIRKGEIVETIHTPTNYRTNQLTKVILSSKHPHTKTLFMASKYKTLPVSSINNDSTNDSSVNSNGNTKPRFFTENALKKTTEHMDRQSSVPVTLKGENIEQTMWQNQNIADPSTHNTIYIKDLSKIYTNKQGGKQLSRTALTNINLEIPKGKITALLGESGSGKSTLSGILAGLDTPTTGTIIINGKPLYSNAKGNSRKNMAELHKHIRIITQNPSTMLNPKMTVKQILQSSATRNYNPATHPYHVKHLLDDFQLPHDILRRQPYQLSGGQKQRIAIMTALVGGATTLIADEITSALDPNSTASLLNLLMDINQRLNTTILLTTHNMAILKGFADRIAVLSNGVLMEYGDAQQVLAKPQSSHTQQLINTVY